MERPWKGERGSTLARRVLVTVLVMPSNSSSNSFLPRLRSVFYARFDESRGPEIAYQVPEGLIASSTGGFISTGTSPTPSGSSRASSIILVPPDRSESRVKPPSQHRSPFSSNRTLLNFDDISKYIIAQSPLCGRLVTCTAGIYKVLGFPVELYGNYERYFFRFRRSELVLRDFYPNRQLQLYRVKDISFLPKSTSSPRLDGSRCSHQVRKHYGAELGSDHGKGTLAPPAIDCSDRGQPLGLQIHRRHQPYSPDRTSCGLRYCPIASSHRTFIVRKSSALLYAFTLSLDTTRSSWSSIYSSIPTCIHTVKASSGSQTRHT